MTSVGRTVGPHPVSATSRDWNSATTLYIGRALHEIAAGRRLRVLDLGCGDGLLISAFMDSGHEFFGFDLPDRAPALQARLGPFFGGDYARRIRIAADERRIPFDDDMFDIVYSNQVFEHVRFLDQMLSEVTRVLRPDGTFVALFPLATYPIEGHCLVPFAHWWPPGRARQRYLTTMLQCRVGRRLPGMSARQSAIEWDDRLRQYTFYRFMNEITGLLDHYFEVSGLDPGGYVDAKIDLLSASGSRLGRAVAACARPLRGTWANWLITHGFMGVFRASRPRSPEQRQRMIAWRA